MESIQKYEILRMIERDGYCHISMDCVEGSLLIYRVQKGDVLDKTLVLDWFRQLVQQLELFYRSGEGRYYRYLNPYSVLVTPDERILLLDTEAESNEFVIRNMQKRAMRNHFVKPILQIRGNVKMDADLYSLGKTIQFTLACTEVQPSFTPLEEYRLSKIIQKCLGENPKNKYQDFKQILKEIPKSKKQHTEKKIDKKIALALAVLCVVGIIGVKSLSDTGASENELPLEESVSETDMTDLNSESSNDVNAEHESEDGNSDSEDLAASSSEEGALALSEMESLRQAFLNNTKEGNEQVIRDGEALKGELLYYLAVAYDREGQTEAAITTYEILCESQCEATVLEQAFYRKVLLEQQNGQMEQAKATCQKGLESFPESEKLKALLDEMEGENENEEESENGAAAETRTEGETVENVAE